MEANVKSETKAMPDMMTKKKKAAEPIAHTVNSVINARPIPHAQVGYRKGNRRAERSRNGPGNSSGSSASSGFGLTGCKIVAALVRPFNAWLRSVAGIQTGDAGISSVVAGSGSPGSATTR